MGTKLSNLPETIAIGDNDEFYVNDSGVSKKIQKTNLFEGRNLTTDGAKLDGIEAGATADQSDAEIKTAYENNADTNAFDDAAVAKLAGIEAGATGDQSDAEIKTAYENNADTNAFTDAEQTKLAGITDLGSGEIITDAERSIYNLGQSTGVISFEGFTIASATTVDIGAGHWHTIDLTDPDSPVVTEHTYAGQFGVTINVAASNITYVYGNNSGGVELSSIELDSSVLYNEKVFLGQIGHPDNATITTVFDFSIKLQNPIGQLHELALALGPIIPRGLEYSAATTGMNLSRSSGYFIESGIGSKTHAQGVTPNTSESFASIASIINFLYVASDNSNISATVLDPDNYDPNGDITNLVAVSPNKFTIQYIVMFRGGFTNIQYGQTQYNSLADAKAVILGGEDYQFASVISESAIVRSAIIMKKGVSGNLSDAVSSGDAFIFGYGLGFQFGGGGSGVSTGAGTLQSVYENSIPSAEIITDDTNGAVSLQRGTTGGDTDDVIEVKNGAGTQVFNVTGEGLVNGRDMVADGSKLDSLASPVVLKNTLIVDENGNDSTGDGTFSAPYLTIQKAIDVLYPTGSPADAADERRRKTIKVYPGAYDADVALPSAGNLTLIAMGAVTIGDAAGTNGASTVARNVTWADDDADEFGQLRPAITFTTVLKADPTSTHAAYGAPGWDISGAFTVSSLGVATTTELQLHGVKLRGVLDASAKSGGLNVNMSKCFFDSSSSAFNLTSAILQRADDCEFDGLINVDSYGRITHCEIGGGMTCTNTPSTSFKPYGIFESIMSGTFTGPATSYRVDEVTNNESSVTLAGGATLDLIDPSTAMQSAASLGLTITGQHGFDTTDKKLVIHDGTQERVYGSGYEMINVTLQITEAKKIKLALLSKDNACTLKRLTYSCDEATDVTFNFEKRTGPTGTPTDVFTVDKTATTTEASTTTFDSGSVAAGDLLYLDIVSFTGTPKNINIDLEFYQDVE